MTTEKRGLVPHKVLSDYGVHLEKGHRMSQESNINHGMPVFSFLNKEGKSITIKVGDKCPICKKRVRGLNHENGDHHKGLAVKCS